MELNPKLKDILYLAKGVYMRDRRYSLVKHNMKQEFIWILTTQFGNLDEDEWVFDKLDDDYEEDNDYEGNERDVDIRFEGNSCICSHIIHKCFSIIHRPTSMTFQVGSECVRKNLPRIFTEYKEREKMKKARAKYYKLTEIKTLAREERDKLNEKKTRDIMNSYTMTFGKYFDEPIASVPLSYINWISSQIKQDDNAFNNYRNFRRVFDLFVRDKGLGLQ